MFFCLRLKASRFKLLAIIFCLFLKVGFAQERAGTTIEGHQIIPYEVQREIDELRQHGHNIDRFPVFRYKINEDALFKLKLGDSIPEALWDMPLMALHRTDTVHTIRLSDYRDKELIILDSWAEWCAPCIKSMILWEEYMKTYPEKVALVGLHLNVSYPALSTLKKRNWNSVSIYGLDARIVNRCFFTKETGSSLVWIYKGRLFALTYTKSYNAEDAIRLIKGENVKIESINNGIY